MYYNARWYDPSLGRFAQADTIVPAGVQGYDRYAYVNNNPVRYTDPSGHMADDGDDGGAVTIPRHPITSSSDDNEEDEENDLKDNTPSLDDFDLKNCDDGPYICKGDSDVGYVYDSQTGLLATWVDGIENVKYSSFNPKNQDKVTINLSKFMEKIDAYQAAKTVRVISGVSAVVGVGSLVLLAIFIPTPAAPASIAAFSVAFVETSVATGVFINSINDVNTARKDAVDYWNGVP